MPKRSYSAAGSYRFGFNGKENDNDVTGLGNQQDYGMRIYDARVGRFLSVDPLQAKYPGLNPFHFSGNNPTSSLDVDGRDTIRFITTRIRIPGYSGINGLKIIPDKEYINYSVVVIQAPGKDVFYKDLVSVNFSAHSTTQSLTRQQFYPKGDGPGGQGGIMKGTGITQSDGALPFMKRNDEDFTSLAKIAPRDLIEYLQAHDPDRYGSLALASAMIQLGEAGQGLAGAALLFEGGISGLVSMSSKFRTTESIILKESNTILNSKDFQIIRNAYEKGVTAEVTINGTKVVYDPGFTFAEAMTLHQEGGFLIGPKAFTATGGINQTVLWEVTRLRTQNGSILGVDQTRSFTDRAKHMSEKLAPKVKKK